MLTIYHYFSLLRSTLSLHREGRGWRAAWARANEILDRESTPKHIPGYKRTGFFDPEDIKIRYQPRPGEHIGEACGNAVALAKHYRLPVDLTFNGTDATAYPSDQEDAVWRRWWETRERNVVIVTDNDGEPD